MNDFAELSTSCYNILCICESWETVLKMYFRNDYQSLTYDWLVELSTSYSNILCICESCETVLKMYFRNDYQSLTYDWLVELSTSYSNILCICESWENVVYCKIAFFDTKCHWFSLNNHTNPFSQESCNWVLISLYYVPTSDFKVLKFLTLLVPQLTIATRLSRIIYR